MFYISIKLYFYNISLYDRVGKVTKITAASCEVSSILILPYNNIKNITVPKLSPHKTET